MKTIIAGSRTITDYSIVKSIIEKSMFNITEIVSGTSYGVDKLGERYGIEHHIPIKRFPAKWNMHGKSAGYKRNVQMGKYADGLIVIHNNSSGSIHMKNIAKKLGLKIEEYIVP